MYNVSICIHVHIVTYTTSVYVYEYLYVCRMMCRIHVYTHIVCTSVSYASFHVCMYPVLYVWAYRHPYLCLHVWLYMYTCKSFSTATETAGSPVSGPGSSHCSFLGELSCDAQPRALQWGRDSHTWGSLNLPLHHTLLSQAAVQADRHPGAVSQWFCGALQSDSDSVCPAQSREFGVFPSPALTAPSPAHGLLQRQLSLLYGLWK